MQRFVNSLKISKYCNMFNEYNFYHCSLPKLASGGFLVYMRSSRERFDKIKKYSLNFVLMMLWQICIICVAIQLFILTFFTFFKGEQIGRGQRSFQIRSSSSRNHCQVTTTSIKSDIYFTLISKSVLA